MSLDDDLRNFTPSEQRDLDELITPEARELRIAWLSRQRRIDSEVPYTTTQNLSVVWLYDFEQ